MWEFDKNESDFNLSFSFKSQKEIQKEKINELSKKPAHLLKPEEVFEIIKVGIKLQKFIPLALELIVKQRYVYFDNPDENEYSILDKQVDYFSKNLSQRERYEKLKLWRKNRGNCISPKTGRARKSYINEAHATEEAIYLSSSYGEQSPFRCDSCGEWHLTPASRHTPNKTCDHCTDGNGESKQLYLTKEAALKRAKIISEERGMLLNVYECPYDQGWHLTKKRV